MHVAATLDGDTGAQKLYTNGVLAAQTITSIRPLGPLDPASGAGVGIGNHSGQPGPLNYPFKGLIDELSLYNRALSATEIQGIVRTNLPRCPGGAPPAIIRQPQSQTVTVGSYASFIAAGSGSSPYAYQWRKDGVPIAVSRFTGASSLTISNVKLTDAGTYSVIATNLYGSAVSSNVILTVNPGPSALRVADANAGSGAAVTVPVLFVPNGLENALSFSLNWNPARLSYVSTILANGAGATLFVNESQTSTGWLGVAMALPAGATFPTGSQELVEVSFSTAV